MGLCTIEYWTWTDHFASIFISHTNRATRVEAKSFGMLWRANDSEQKPSKFGWVARKALTWNKLRMTDITCFQWIRNARRYCHYKAYMSSYRMLHHFFIISIHRFAAIRINLRLLSSAKCHAKKILRSLLLFSSHCKFSCVQYDDFLLQWKFAFGSGRTQQHLFEKLFIDGKQLAKEFVDFVLCARTCDGTKTREKLTKMQAAATIKQLVWFVECKCECDDDQ